MPSPESQSPPSSSFTVINMPPSQLLLILLVIVIASSPFVSAANNEKIGKPHSTVLQLTSNNFDDYIQDPANGLWLLDFYAPWCGHCKKLAPVLDAVAPFLAGKMAIGKIDCTSDKKLCNRFDVKGYPTLKYYRDGDFQNYPLSRDKDTIITFGEKMSARAVTIVSTHLEATEKLLHKSPVAFIVYDPTNDSSSESPVSSSEIDETIDASGATESEKAVEKLIQSTERTRIFGQVARKMQALSSFGLLSPLDTTPEEITKLLRHGNDDADDETSPVPPSSSGGGFIARIEKDIPIKIFDGDISTSAVTDFVRENNLATVINLSGDNFRLASRRGKALAITIYDPEDGSVETERHRRELKQYAITGAYKDDFIFATMDGRKWDKFLGQFSVDKKNLPQFVVVDVPERTYWQDSSVADITNFIAAVKNDTIQSRKQEKAKSGLADMILQSFVDYMPWSLMLVFAVMAFVFWLVLRIDDGPTLQLKKTRTRAASGNSNKKDQ